MTKLARRTHIPVKWTQDELARIAHNDHQLLARQLISSLHQDRRERDLASGPAGKPALERFGRCEQSACNSVGGDTGGSLAS
jgi:hypothetical protein